MSIIGTIYEDVPTDVLGVIGPWQWLVTSVASAFMVTNLFNYHENMLYLEPPDSGSTLCVVPVKLHHNNATLCQIQNGTSFSPCQMWSIKLLNTLWIRKSWLIFCQDKSQRLAVAMICRLGLAFGCVIMGIVADCLGRKKAAAIGIMSSIPLTLLATFGSTDPWFRLFIFLKAICSSVNMFIGIVIVCEIASNGWRPTLMFVVAGPRIVGLVYSVLLANSIPNHETTGLLAAVINIIILCLLKWLPESPLWLLYSRKIKIAERQLARAARRNGVQLISSFKIRPVNQRAYQCVEATMTCIEIFQSYNIKLTIIVEMSIWCFLSSLWTIAYYLVLVDKPPGIVWGMILCSVIILGCLYMLLSKIIKIRYLLLCYILFTGAFTGCNLFLFKTNHEIITIFLSTLSISCGVISYYMCLVITPRRFATKIRATVFGCCLAVGELASIVFCLLLVLMPINLYVLTGVIIALTLSLCALCLLLQDVDGRELPDILEDMDYYSDLTKPLRWATLKTNNPSHEEFEMTVHYFDSNGAVDISSLPSSTHTIQRTPPRRIGFAKIWNFFKDSFCSNKRSTS